MTDEAPRPSRPPVGRIRVLHQAYPGTGVCLYCKTPRDDWEPMQECPARRLSVKKRKHLPPHFRALWGKTVLEAEAYLASTPTFDPRSGARLTELRVLDGSPIFLDSRVERLNVRLTDGRITDVDGAY